MPIRQVFIIGATMALIGGALTVAHGGADDDKRNVNWSDSLVLLHNIFKDLAKEKGLIEQYKLYLRAESTFNQIRVELTETEFKRMGRTLKASFGRLPAPPEIVVQDELIFREVTMKDQTFYWSNPVSNDLLARFLNENRIPDELRSKIVRGEQSAVVYDDATETYSTTRGTEQAQGFTYGLAYDVTKWLANRWKVKSYLPSVPMIAACRNLEIACWSRTPWKEKNDRRRESWEMFGAEFYTLFRDGRFMEDLPEAFYPDVRLHLVVSEASAKRVLLRSLSVRE